MFKNQFIQTFSANPKYDKFIISAYSAVGNQHNCLAGESQAQDDEEATT